MKKEFRKVARLQDRSAYQPQLIAATETIPPRVETLGSHLIKAPNGQIGQASAGFRGVSSLRFEVEFWIRSGSEFGNWQSALRHYPLRVRTAEFHFDLPPELIAQFPAAQRDESRLLVLHRASGQLEHKKFRDVLDYFRAGDVLVLNNSRVIPARLRGAAGPLAQERWNQRTDRTNVASNPPYSSGPLQDCGISAPWTKPPAYITWINSGNPSNQEQFSDALEIFRSQVLLLFVLFK